MEMKTVKLGDICVSITDGTHQAPPKSKDGVPFITISNITADNRLDYSVYTFVPTDFYESINDRQKAKIGDILYSVVGSFGKAVFINENKPFVFQRHIAILRPGDDVNNKYLYYILSSPEFYRKADLVALGAAQRTISLKNLRNMEVNLPSRPVQDKIASILSAYDDMIDNCKKQIALLEEAAQRLYREWFVDLRFPGHEITPIGENGLPKGWQKLFISVPFTIKYGKNLSTKLISQEGRSPVYGASGCIGYYHTNNVSDYTVLITSRGNSSGRVHRTFHKKSFVTNNSFIVSPKLEYNYIPLSYIFYSLKNIDLTRFKTGSAQPQLTNASINNVEYLLPNNSILKTFGIICDAYLVKIAVLKRLIEQCNVTKSIVLPRLISGQIAINA